MVMPNMLTESSTETGPGTEKGRRPTIVPSPVAASPELTDRPRRRSFTAQAKLRILADIDRVAGTGGIGAILRREGLYSSALSDWRRQRDAGALGALTPSKRGPKPPPANPLATELANARRDNIRLQQRLERAEAIIGLQKKLGELLGVPSVVSDAES